MIKIMIKTMIKNMRASRTFYELKAPTDNKIFIFFRTFRC